MTRIGTSYFVDEAAARKYYRPYTSYPMNMYKFVEAKIAAGEIHIGKPPLKSGERLIVIDEGTRYAIEETAS